MKLNGTFVKHEDLVAAGCSDGVGADMSSNDDSVTLRLRDGSEISCSLNLLRRSSAYFAAIFEGDYVESRSGRIQLSHLEPRAVKTILCYLQNEDSDRDVLHFWVGHGLFGSIDTEALEEALDYLQIGGRNTSTASQTVQVIHLLNDPNLIRSECEKQGWISADTGEVLSIPFGRKKRFWRHWVCFLLCIQIMAKENERVDQETFTARLGDLGEGSGGSVALRRELIEHGLIEREGDGSAYWRPPFTIKKIRSWITGMPRRVI